MEIISSIVKAAYANARSTPIAFTDPLRLHRERSRIWVEALASEFRNFHCGDLNVRVFSKHCPDSRREFHLNELLYDVCVCRVEAVPSAVHKRELIYIKEPLWLIESEFAKDSRQALIDFNKLVLGSSQNKLFVGPQVKDNESFIEVLVPPASACTGNVFLALLPHPALWDSGHGEGPLFWRFTNGAWLAEASS
jgi:hypothetical protein